MVSFKFEENIPPNDNKMLLSLYKSFFLQYFYKNTIILL